jgi:hypothetical protein
MKTCRVCNSTKPESEFSRDGGTKDGLRNECKPCAHEIYKKWKSTEHGKSIRRQGAAKRRASHKNNAGAHNAIFYAVKCGLIKKPDICEWCHILETPENPLEAHHWLGYDNPRNWVNVRWVHRLECHKIVENLLPSDWPTDTLEPYTTH